MLSKACLVELLEYFPYASLEIHFCLFPQSIFCTSFRAKWKATPLSVISWHRRNLSTYNWLAGINLSVPATLHQSDTPFADIWSFPTKQWTLVLEQAYFLLPTLPQPPSLAPKGCHFYKFKDNGHGNTNMNKQLLNAPKIRLHCRLMTSQAAQP